ncbi:MAG: peptidoglycan bridge formation glycyltransferase FemA/FemB family protein [Anaerolineae bacterium]|nr:peptidoglycan bridge formation glycyltransferase FemA/FemB family protein [Anaerolineae bacterium]
MKNLLTTTPAHWDERLAAGQGHLLQSWNWGEFKRHFDWTPQRIQIDDAAAQILFRQLPLGLSIAYIPKGPLVDWANPDQCQRLFSAIHTAAKKQRAVFLKIEPDVWCDDASADEAQAVQTILRQANFTPADTIQPQSTILIDISGDEKSILAAMKQKTRYNIRLAGRKGVTIRYGQAEDIATFHSLAQTTASRDGFGVHAPDYYRLAYAYFAPDRCALLIAEFEGEPLAALMVFRYHEMAYYFYGASSNSHRNLMAPYLIQWEAMRWAKEHGCTRYDLWGIPNVDPDTLESEFTERHDGLWGVYRFKRGFGGQIVQSVGAYDFVYNPLLYKIYQFRRGSTAE